MNPIQERILQLLHNLGTLNLNYRRIAKKIGEKYPEKIKYHLKKLVEQGLIRIDEENKKIIRITPADIESNVNPLPIYGTANCGEAVSFADDEVKGYLKVSKKILPKFSKDLYALRASGDSMNRAEIGNKKLNINDGDFVVIDKRSFNPRPGDCIVSVIDGYANIKEFYCDPELKQVRLISRSTEDYFPIILHQSDSLHVMGKVVDVIKSS